MKSLSIICNIFAWLEYFKEYIWIKWSGLEPSDRPVCSTDWDSHSNNCNSHITNCCTCVLLLVLLGCEWMCQLFNIFLWARDDQEARLCCCFESTLSRLCHESQEAKITPSESPCSWCSGLWLKHDIRCCHVWKAAQCTVDDVLGEKWVTQPSEIQPVPSSHVEISLEHQAQASTAALANTATLRPQTGRDEAATRQHMLWQTLCLD